jgi:hypothetical protein
MGRDEKAQGACADWDDGVYTQHTCILFHTENRMSAKPEQDRGTRVCEQMSEMGTQLSINVFVDKVTTHHPELLSGQELGL